ncbi:MAG TPA: endopeptidase La [Phycisphaerae bacterium]|nr:endopeptidase La [Phycisphaerae bacterium]HUT61156.1 endopeptidase La [Phycisphaerae bacterium]
MAQDNPSKQKIVKEDEAEQIVRPGGAPQGGHGPQEQQLDIPLEVGILPVRNIVVFPGMVIPMGVARAKSRRLLGETLPDQKIIVVLSQKLFETEDPGPDDLHQAGTAVMILKLLRMEDANQSIIIHGLARVRVEQWLAQEPYLRARIRVLAETTRGGTETEALVMHVRNLAGRVMKHIPNMPEEAAVVVNNVEQPGALADFVASNLLQVDVATKQRLLEELDVAERLRAVGLELQRQLDVMELSDKIQSQVKDSIDKSQREYFLHEQLKAIQEELGEVDERTSEVQSLRQKIEQAGMPEPVKAEALRELGRMEKIPTVSPEYNVVRTYLDIMIELPWSAATRDRLDVNAARKVLDEDHYDLDKVKRRILEYLAVRKLAPESRGPILCFVGPPGVGKTSLGQSIARTLGRKFIRMSLGGMRDEAELRGHRRTYIGAMPGRIVQEIRKAGTNNPVFMLDELDKVGADFRGDPTSALLEILDPAQNNTFQDHYLNVPFDLSNVLFIGTANYMVPVPPALRDRMEVIGLPGYTAREKVHIAMKYLLPRQLKENGLKAAQARWNEKAVAEIIDSYTREAGVRELERQIGAVCRGIAAMIASGKARSRRVDHKLITRMLGPRKYESELALRTATPGVATGLAYTPNGGEIVFVEAARFPGKGMLMLTGQIGEIMKESAQAAMSLVKSRTEELGLDAKLFANTDVHVHVPAGAVPKDGPSAGVAMVTAMTSLLTGKPVRSDVAMTGEITLRGLVLPVGGVKEKVLAAKRAGIRTVILPRGNRKDLVDVPAEARRGLKFVFAKTVRDALGEALSAADGPKRRPAGRKTARSRSARRGGK